MKILDFIFGRKRASLEIITLDPRVFYNAYMPPIEPVMQFEERVKPSRMTGEQFIQYLQSQGFVVKGHIDKSGHRAPQMDHKQPKASL